MAFARVQAVAPGQYAGVFRDIGDVFDIALSTDLSDSTVSQVPPGNPNYPIYGWMLVVAPTTPLYSFALANQGGSSNVKETIGQNTAGQQVWGQPPGTIGGRYVV